MSDKHVAPVFVYYIVFEKHRSPTAFSRSWVIRKTENDMDTVDGLHNELCDIERESGCNIWVINWRKLEGELPVPAVPTVKAKVEVEDG